MFPARPSLVRKASRECGEARTDLGFPPDLRPCQPRRIPPLCVTHHPTFAGVSERRPNDPRGSGSFSEHRALWFGRPRGGTCGEARIAPGVCAATGLVGLAAYFGRSFNAVSTLSPLTAMCSAPASSTPGNDDPSGIPVLVVELADEAAVRPVWCPQGPASPQYGDTAPDGGLGRRRNH